MMPAFSRQKRAFTLIEILIATTILAVVLGSIYSTWLSIVRATERGERTAADVQRTRMAVSAVEEALAGAAMFSENVLYYSFDVDTTGEFALLSFVSRLPESFPGSGMFPGQPLRRVTFSVEPGSDGNNTLVMRQQPVLELLEDNQEAYAITLARNVSRFELEFWDTNITDWAYDWAYTNQLPRMMRMLFGFGGENGKVRVAEDLVAKVVSIPSQAVTRDYQLPTATAGGMGGGVTVIQMLPDGTRILSDGSRILPDGRRVSKDGQPLPPINIGGRGGDRGRDGQRPGGRPGGPGDFGPRNPNQPQPGPNRQFQPNPAQPPPGPNQPFNPFGPGGGTSPRGGRR